MELTLARHREQDQTARSDDVTRHQVPDQFNVRVIAALADADDQSFANQTDV